MATLDIITVPDPILKTVSDPVDQVNDAVRRLMDQMLETMYEAPGIGLAAIQVAVPKRILVVDVAREEDPKTPLFLVNPQIVWKSDAMRLHEEGCLSVPEHYAEIERPERIKVRFLDYEGNLREEDFEDILSTVVQHEMDHLNGVLFIDHLSRLKRDRVIKKMVKAKKLETVL